MLLCEGFIASHVDSDMELDVFHLFLQDLEFRVRGRELFGEHFQLSAALYDPDKAYMSRDRALWR